MGSNRGAGGRKKGKGPTPESLFSKFRPVERRLFAAEYALSLLLGGKLPQVEKFIFDAVFDLHQVSSSDLLQSSGSARASRLSGLIKTSFDSGQVKISLFYGKDLSPAEVNLFSRSFAEVMAATYAAVGFDMTGLPAGRKMVQPEE